MAKATHRQQEKRYELEKVEGGYVTLRRLNHGEKLDRLDESMHFESGEGDHAKVFVSTARTRLFDFAHCIVGHNLEDDDGKILDFKNPADVRRLDGAIGDEIAEKISDHNETIGDDPKDAEVPN